MVEKWFERAEGMKRQRRVDPRICKALLADEAPCLGCNKKIGCHRKHKPAQCKGPCSAPLCNADASVIGGDAEMRTPAPNKRSSRTRRQQPASHSPPNLTTKHATAADARAASRKKTQNAAEYQAKISKQKPAKSAGELIISAFIQKFY